MRHAFALLGLMSFILIIGLYLAFSKPAEAPVELTPNVTETMSLTLSSSSFPNGGNIPSRFTCDGENINPEMTISNIPEDTESLVLVMDDPDIPEAVKESRGIEKFDHWVLYNISPDTLVINEGESVGVSGITSTGGEGYIGPCPPDKEHRYIFRLYALSGTLNFIKLPTLDEVEEAAKGMVLESAELMGRYERL